MNRSTLKACAALLAALAASAFFLYAAPGSGEGESAASQARTAFLKKCLRHVTAQACSAPSAARVPG